MSDILKSLTVAEVDREIARIDEQRRKQLRALKALKRHLEVKEEVELDAEYSDLAE